MSTWETVSYEVDGAVATISIDRDEVMNAFNRQLRLDLLAAFGRAVDDPEVRVIVFTGAGRGFSAGADLKDAISTREAGNQRIEEQLQREYRPVLEIIGRSEKPVIASINGAAAGIGLSFALICDLAIMSDKAFLLAPFANIGLVPDGGATWLLAKQLGYKRAFQLCVEAERISADRCLEWGLVNKVVAADELRSATAGWAASLAKRAPLSMAATKRAMRHAMGGTWGSTFDVEAGLQDALIRSEDNVEGVSAFFEKREPEFKGR